MKESDEKTNHQRADERGIRIQQRNAMIERAAEALAHGGYSNLTDSEVEAMNNDPEWARAVESRAKSIRRGNQKKENDQEV